LLVLSFLPFTPGSCMLSSPASSAGLCWFSLSLLVVLVLPTPTDSSFILIQRPQWLSLIRHAAIHSHGSFPRTFGFVQLVSRGLTPTDSLCCSCYSSGPSGSCSPTPLLIHVVSVVCYLQLPGTLDDFHVASCQSMSLGLYACWFTLHVASCRSY
jgi:hypothetical protein